LRIAKAARSAQMRGRMGYCGPLGGLSERYYSCFAPNRPPRRDLRAEHCGREAPGGEYIDAFPRAAPSSRLFDLGGDFTLANWIIDVLCFQHGPSIAGRSGPGSPFVRPPDASAPNSRAGASFPPLGAIAGGIHFFDNVCPLDPRLAPSRGSLSDLVDCWPGLLPRASPELPPGGSIPARQFGYI